jgi:hypothetical protein
MANLSREARLGRKITKEAYKKKVEKASPSTFIVVAMPLFPRRKKIDLRKCSNAILPTVCVRRSAVSPRMSVVLGLRLETRLHS